MDNTITKLQTGHGIGVTLYDTSDNALGNVANPLNVTGSFSASSSANATAATPTYIEGTPEPFSQDLSGHLRTISEIDQSVPGSTNAVDVTNLPVTVDTAAGNSSASTIRVVVASNQTAIPITGSITATNPSVSATGSAVPASATYLGATVAGTLTGLVATANGLKVDGSGATQPISGSISNTSFAATQATAASLNATVVGTGTFAVQAAQSGTWTVGISAAQTIAVTNTGTFATQASQSGTWNIGTVTTLTGITPAFGATASSVPASSGYQGLRGTTANPTAVTDGQMVGAQGDKEGRLTTVPYAVRDLAGQQKTTISASTAETTIVTAVASTFLDILSFNFSNTGATATKVDIRDTTGGSVVATFMVPAGDMRGQTYTLPFKQTTANTNWTAQCASSTTAMEVTVQYVRNI